MAHPAIPAWHEIARETLIVMAGALIAVAIVRLLPVKVQAFFRLPPLEGTQQ